MFDTHGSPLRFWLALAMLCALPLLLPTRFAARAADENSVKRRLDSMEENAKKGEWNSMKADIEVITEWIKDLPEASRDQYTKRVEPLRKTYEAKMAKDYHDNILKMVRNSLDRSKEWINDNRPNSEDIDRAENLLEKYKDVLTQDEKKELASEAAILRKQMTKITMGKDLERLSSDLAQAEKDFPEVEKQLMDPNATQGFSSNSLAGKINGIVDKLKKLPQDDPTVKDLTARATKLDAAFDKAANTGKRGHILGRVKEEWAHIKDEFKGWESEQAPAYADWLKSGELKLDKTAEALRKVRQWEDYGTTKELVKDFGNDAETKAMTDEAAKIKAAASDRLVKAIDAIVAAGEKNPSKEGYERFQFFTNTVERFLDGLPSKEGYVTRIKGIRDKWDAKMASEDKAATELYDKLADQAKAAWPGMVSKLKVEENFSPQEILKNPSAYKGKLIYLKDTDNRASWELAGNGYDFAVKVDGTPIAGKYIPAISKAIDDAPTSKERGVFDRHLDIVARIEGECKVQESTYYQALQKWVPEFNHPGVKVTVIGYRGGPLAVLEGSSSGSVTSGGASAGPSTDSGSTGVFEWLMRIFWLLVGLTAAAVAFLKARPELATQAISSASPAGATATATATMTQMSQKIDLIGLAIAGLGVLWLLTSLIYRDLLPAAAVTACGLYAAGDFLKTRGVPEATINQVKPFGMILAIATAGLVFLHLFFGGYALL